MDTPRTQQAELAGGMKLSKWCEAVGICLATANKWRNEGKLQVVDRYGMQFITATEMRRFFEGNGERQLRGIAALKAAKKAAEARAAVPPEPAGAA
jgi:hypothetical protein